MMKEEVKIKKTLQLYPIFSGLSMDLLFWSAINTLFLTGVKGLSASSINSLLPISLLFIIFFQPIAFKIIKRIGNVFSVRLGILFLFLGSLLLTFSNHFFFILLGTILYESSFLFKNMDSVILRKNLKKEKKEKDFIIYQSRASMVYSIATMLIAFCSGFLFKINAYLPMICCVVCCAVLFILSFFLYECKNDLQEEVSHSEDKAFKLSLFLILLLLFFGTSYSAVDIGQINGKLLMQEQMEYFLSTSHVAIVFSFIIAVSRIVRVLSNILFPHIIKKWKERVLCLILSLLLFAYLFIICGSFIQNGFLGILFIAIGFFLFLALRDPLYNYSCTLLLDSCEEKNHEKAMSYFTLANKLGKLIIGTFVSLVLLKFSIVYAIFILFFIMLVDLFLSFKIYKMIHS